MPCTLGSVLCFADLGYVPTISTTISILIAVAAGCRYTHFVWYSSAQALSSSSGKPSHVIVQLSGLLSVARFGFRKGLVSRFPKGVWGAKRLRRGGCPSPARSQPYLYRLVELVWFLFRFDWYCSKSYTESNLGCASPGNVFVGLWVPSTSRPLVTSEGYECSIN